MASVTIKVTILREARFAESGAGVVVGAGVVGSVVGAAVEIVVGGWVEVEVGAAVVVGVAVVDSVVVGAVVILSVVVGVVVVGSNESTNPVSKYALNSATLSL